MAKKKYKSDPLKAAHQIAVGLYRNGRIDTKTMREFDASCLDTNQKEISSTLAAKGKIRLPARPGGVKKFKGATIKGKSITETILEDRR